MKLGVVHLQLGVTMDERIKICHFERGKAPNG